MQLTMFRAVAMIQNDVAMKFEFCFMMSRDGMADRRRQAWSS